MCKNKLSFNNNRLTQLAGDGTLKYQRGNCRIKPMGAYTSIRVFPAIEG